MKPDDGAAIRTATRDDLDAIMALERASFPTDAWSERLMRDELVSPHGRYLVLESGGALAGYGGLRAPSRSRDGDIQTIAVAAASRGRGWGRMLLDALIDEAVARGVRDLFLEVRADNPVAQALYASEGFREVGRRAHYYQPDDVDAIVMQADLRVRAADPAARTPLKSAESARNGPDSGIAARIEGVLRGAAANPAQEGTRDDA
ncbi:ribosomal protein S18-alanine N-acetyltransferase [Microbacterium kribbense]|uniref:Ribosomal protein S18-alanine N-acetyltransferase n=1 Tax=Microbacterium kribbense TaxID=433645 RepID=A0ABP7GGA8_9MICO